MGRARWWRKWFAAIELEGFFATPTTEHTWFNYSYGCSAVTIYPDSWVVGEGLTLD